ncbi:hypothetical protein [Streptomyces sp. NBC_00059]|uniref:hypothetical protein n=1 Tax=Streptomyces sp. NBC_00059 TaxID=2975635 RepID=UPI0022513953|nr:hypothetical protein [Streptomyces sp. NBC_00059]MCX5416710.1 hypothetical protein [Streptomyces sp. NBC_00059]
MSGGGDGPASGRRIGEVAALISAAAAVIGLLLAVFGIPSVGGSSVNRSIAEDAAAAPASSSPLSSPSSSPSSSRAPSSASLSAPPPTKSAGPLPKGWRMVHAPALRADFAVPEGWKKKRDSDIQSEWHSPDGVHSMTLKRDRSYGSTAEAAADGQLAWYRNTAESSMADLTVTARPTRQNGKEALWLEIDYHWVRESGPRKRVEVFVAGRSGDVYQLLFDTVDTPDRIAEQQRMFTTARSRLLIDRAR